MREGRRKDDRHIHVFAGKEVTGTDHCIHCGCTYPEAHAIDPILYPEEGLQVPPDSGYIKFTPLPVNNVRIHFNGIGSKDSAGIIYNFYRRKRFNRFQVWMMQVCFGWLVEQDIDLPSGEQ